VNGEGSTNQEFRARHPRVGGLLLPLQVQPQSTRSWARRAEAERRASAALDRIARVTAHLEESSPPA